MPALKSNPQNHNRISLRLPGWDYSQSGAYFITTVTRGRENLFGDIKDGQMHLNEAGQVVWAVWNSLPERYPHITTGMASVMPNHFHGIIEINNPVGTIHESSLRGIQLIKSRRRMTLPLVVGYFKMNTAKLINKLLGSEGNPVWQRNYYEHIIRSDDDYERVHFYIETNVENWKTDDENRAKSI
jgi:putative transposase